MHHIENHHFDTTGLEKPILAIVLPAFNEAETIKEVVSNYFNEIATKLPSTLIVAEDGSIDRTPQILASLAKEIPISLFSDRKRKGFAKAVSDALNECNEDWIFFSDSDGQYFPSDFWSLWENRHGNDLIIGQKVHRDEGIHRLLLSRVFHAFVNLIFSLSLKDGDSGFRLIRKDVIKSVVNETQALKYSFWTEFTIRASLKGFRIREVPISHANRKNGRTRIYTVPLMPLIALKQLRGLATLYAYTRKNN
jgi:glycosyltransferase involved in cell wall biosynthesis